MTGAVLTINAGSSSIKFKLFDAGDALACIASGEVEEIGIAPSLTIKDAHGAVLAANKWDRGAAMTYEMLLESILDWVATHLGSATLLAAGHRIVHGGRDFSGPVRLDAATLTALEALTPLAPLHQPHNLAAVRAVRALRPGLPQIGCFDTAFHHGMPHVATRMALPRHFDDEGLRRYGFHGLSYEFIARRLRDIAPHTAYGRVIAAHLGNGASLCAMIDGKSIDTTMGLTALEGLVMGTRCGSIDPGAILYLMQAHAMTVEAVTHLLYEQSGLLGVSGLSADMRVLLTSDDPHAKEAVELFAFRAAREVAALTASLSGLDCLIFTAGIGEHAPPVRAAICARLGWLGVEIDDFANQHHAAVISTASSRVVVRVIPTDEEAMIARHCIEIIRPGADSHSR
jgi:acetate kinase